MAFRNDLLFEWQKKEFITSAAKAARIIGISPTFYQCLVKGNKKPGITTLEKISKKTGIPITELLSDNEKGDC